MRARDVYLSSAVLLCDLCRSMYGGEVEGRGRELCHVDGGGAGAWVGRLSLSLYICSM